MPKVTTQQPIGGEQQTQQDQSNDQPEVGSARAATSASTGGLGCEQNKSGSGSAASSSGAANETKGQAKSLSRPPSQQQQQRQITNSQGRAREISISNSNEFTGEPAALALARPKQGVSEPPLQLQASGRSSAASSSCSGRQQSGLPRVSSSSAPSSGGGGGTSSTSSLGSCKKFLIKKISSSNLRTFLGRRRHRTAGTAGKSKSQPSGRAAQDKTTAATAATTSGSSSSSRAQVQAAAASRSEDNLWHRRNRARQQHCDARQDASDECAHQSRDQSVTNLSARNCASLVPSSAAASLGAAGQVDTDANQILFASGGKQQVEEGEICGSGRQATTLTKLRKAKTIASPGDDREGMAPPPPSMSHGGAVARIELMSAADDDQDLKEHEGDNPVQQPPAVLAEETSRSCCVASKRLRELTAHLEHGSVPRSVLYETLEFAASVLESITMDQVSRVSDEDDGDLSEVQSDAVPNEVRKWLETTFTRNSISQKRRTEDKLKFRSVANAIRAGIVVDKIYRRMSASTPFVSQEVSNLLKCIDDWSFNCFQVNQVSQGQVLKSVGYELFNRYGLMYKFKIPTTILKNFLTQVESGYTKHKNPYHNNLHAADVTQTVHYMLWQAGLTNWLTDLEIFATLLAAIIHDYLHTGTTNNFHVMSQSTTALVYNDRAVLENFHISQAFTLMRNEDCNILAGLTKDEYREFRSLVIDMVLATDMSSHFQQIKAMKNILNHADNFNADKSKILSLVIHISDISHPAKEWELHSQWTGLLMEEFFRQGDREKELELECSPLCDRETTLVAESQLGFIEFIVSPSLEICGDVLDRVHYQMAEANTRPVLPASAKAASMVLGAVKPAAIAAAASDDKSAPAAGGGGGGDQSRNEPRTTTISELLEQSSINEPPAPVPPPPPSGDTTRRQSMAPRQAQQQQQPGQQRKRPSVSSAGSSSSHSVASSASSFASSFVSSETIASNLRKMIASSSASLSRKLNISTGLGGSPTPPAATVPLAANHSSSSASSSSPSASVNQQQQRITISTAQSRPTTEGERTETLAEFEARQAQYRHPVIQCSSGSSARPKSSMAGNRPTGRSGDGEQPGAAGSAANPGRQEQQNAEQQVASTTSQLVLKRSGASPTPLMAGGLGSRSAPPLQYFKIQRPWVACLERNKKMWRERALAEANKPSTSTAQGQT